MPKRTARIPCIRLSAHATNRRETALRKMACSFIASLLASPRLAARGDRAWAGFGGSRTGSRARRSTISFARTASSLGTGASPRGEGAAAVELVKPRASASRLALRVEVFVGRNERGASRLLEVPAHRTTMARTVWMPDLATVPGEISTRGVDHSPSGSTSRRRARSSWRTTRGSTGRSSSGCSRPRARGPGRARARRSRGLRRASRARRCIACYVPTGSTPGTGTARSRTARRGCGCSRSASRSRATPSSPRCAGGRSPRRCALWAIRSPFASKEALRARGYRWMPEMRDGIERSWWTDVEPDEAESELAWLLEAVYGGAWGYLPPGGIPQRRVSAFERWRTDPSDLAHPRPSSRAPSVRARRKPAEAPKSVGSNGDGKLDPGPDSQAP